MPEKFDRCVKEVKKKIKEGKLPENSNPYAICHASLNKSRKDK